MNPSLMALIELAATAKLGSPPTDDLSSETVFPELVAPLMRYEMLLQQKVEDTIREHVNSVTVEDLIKAKELYTGDYLTSLSIPYSGISRLCQELINLCITYSLSIPVVWQKYADGAFDWDADIAYMQTL